MVQFLDAPRGNREPQRFEPRHIADCSAELTVTLSRCNAKQNKTCRVGQAVETEEIQRRLCIHHCRFCHLFAVLCTVDYMSIRARIDEGFARQAHRINQWTHGSKTDNMVMTTEAPTCKYWWIFRRLRSLWRWEQYGLVGEALSEEKDNASPPLVLGPDRFRPWPQPVEKDSWAAAGEICIAIKATTRRRAKYREVRVCWPVAPILQ